MQNNDSSLNVSNNQKDYWMSKQKEVEERFMEVDKEGQDPDLMAPKPRKQKRTKKGVPQAKKIPMPDLQQSFKLNAWIKFLPQQMQNLQM